MKLSVVIPVHNKAPWLKECLDSVFAQEIEEMEVIAVDDASTDESLSILEGYGNDRLKVVELKTNVGPGMAAQTGHDLAEGEYIIRVDADDVQHPQRFRKQIGFMDAHPGTGICGSHMRLLGTTQVRPKPAGHERIHAGLLFRIGVYQPSMILRRRVLVDNNIRYLPEWPWFGEDWLLEMRLAEVTRFDNIQEALVEYREGGISARRGHDELHRMYRAVFEWAGLPEPSARELDLHCMAIMQFRERPSAKDVRDLKHWLRHLEQWNERSRRFDPRHLQERIGQIWDELFHYLTPAGPAPVLAWTRNGGRLTPARLYYLLRTIKF
jgi:glycosyltransferase involved in cell wall biosynthesis